jgi:non-ribosomal peptide synthetase component F
MRSFSGGTATGDLNFSRAAKPCAEACYPTPTQSPGLYISILAVSENDAAFCSINPDSPSDRIKFVVEDVSAHVVITTRSRVQVASWEGGPRVILVDENYPIPPGNLQSISSRPIQPHDLTYVMYTSGSSGTPKGVTSCFH